MHFEGETLWPGIIGQLSVFTVFVTAILGALAYFLATLKKQNEKEYKEWLQAANVMAWTNLIGIFIIFISLYYIIYNHLFEYRYAWEHSNLQLPTKYLLSCFWEGQEGSFLLWMIWNAVLSVFIICFSGDWKPYVMFSFMLVQAFLASMLLGLEIGSVKIGSTPFMLLRDHFVDAPVFKRADYLSFIKDGNGLNPLLQNYWMVIHPPTLFLGFASTLVPFAYAIAALWRNEYYRWTQPALTWSLFSAAILGTGIMMGAAWAYESLTFGGYWAWDPVENASLVPWLILVAGVHTLLVYKKTGHSLRITLVFFILTFILILYSTFLTRSGILGETSVHAFTDLGMSGQLVIYMAALSIPALILFALRYKHLPKQDKEEHIYSREFWIFIGSLMLMLSALQVIFTTSIPVFNKILGTQWAPPTDAVAHYNKWQLPFAIVITLLASVTLYLKFKKTEPGYFAKKLLINLILSVLITVLVSWMAEIDYFAYQAFLFSGIFAVVANAYYFIDVLSGKWKVSGPAMGHFGFGLMLVGILISSYNKHVISRNTLGIDFGKEFDDQAKRENMLLYKNISSQLGPYTVTYVGDSVNGPNTYYKVHYLRYDSVKNEVAEEFYLHPNAQVNPKMGLISNPDTRHYLTYDIYTHVTSVPDRSKQESPNDNAYKEHILRIGDSLFTSKFYVILSRVNKITSADDPQIQAGDIAVRATLNIRAMNGFSQTAEPLFIIRNSRIISEPVSFTDLGLNFRFVNINPSEETFTIAVAETEAIPDYIVMKAIVFPQINLLWLGFILMTLGFVVSIIRIFMKQKKPNASTATSA
jgi:cytochrome c-type biogenesis protein CcmF